MSENKFSILYVDDEESNLKGFRSIYFTEYKIHTATSGQQALDILANNEIHIIITDQKMPGMTGVQFLSSTLEKYPDPIRIILTGYSDIEVLMQAINECGIFRYLTKPWNEAEMNMTLRQAIDTYCLRKENTELIRMLKEANVTLEEKVKVRTQKIEELISTVAHDLRSPLSQMRALLHLIQLEFPEIDPMHKNYNEMIAQAADRLKTMINRILDINAIEHRDINVKIEAVNLTELVHDAASQVSKLCSDKNLKLHLNFSHDDEHARVDSGYFLQVLENLLSNAVKFSPPHKNIYIDTEKSNNSLKIIVRDEGPGLTENDMKLIFQKYQQLSAKPTSGEDSSGLGLYLAKKYIENMNGRIWCESRPGEGASFTIELMK